MIFNNNTTVIDIDDENINEFEYFNIQQYLFDVPECIFLDYYQNYGSRLLTIYVVPVSSRPDRPQTNIKFIINQKIESVSAL